MAKKRIVKPDILVLFGEAESALAEIDRNLGDSPQDLEMPTLRSLFEA